MSFFVPRGKPKVKLAQYRRTILRNGGLPLHERSITTYSEVRQRSESGPASLAKGFGYFNALLLCKGKEFCITSSSVRSQRLSLRLEEVRVISAHQREQDKSDHFWHKEFRLKVIEISGVA